ncbi:hypothetical protein [Lysinibacillus pakistanensis]|uniref:Uncharacterized protein n=1 Tax=Lysinibacillus pakistanensis TaxID=759811 RepID=A0ABX6DCJ1_9BACI|nr:hypothetical protein GDS87_15205 [Lysinibacillus pakistanensis]
MFANMPTTVEGAKLQLTQEQEAKFRVVYRKTKDEQGAYFADLWNPEIDYTDEFIIVPLRSVYDGVTDPLAIGTKFANVEGSTDDLKHGEKSWIQLLLKYLPAGDVDSCCAEHNKIYVGDSQDESDDKTKKFSCGGTLVGGHVILQATNSSTVDEGGNVHLLPICHKHNTFRYTGWTGAGYYMKLARQMKAVKLKSYFQLSALVEE